MTALRLAASLVHTVPGLRARVRHADRVLLEVARAPHPSAPSITPCEFRFAVARGHAQLEAGARLGFLGLDPRADVAVEVGVPPGGATLPGGLYRLPVGDEILHAFATALPLPRCRDLLTTPSIPDGDPRELHLHHDVATGVTIVLNRCDTEGEIDDRRRRLEEARCRLVAEEVAVALAVA